MDENRHDEITLLISLISLPAFGLLKPQTPLAHLLRRGLPRRGQRAVATIGAAIVDFSPNGLDGSSEAITNILMTKKRIPPQLKLPPTPAANSVVTPVDPSDLTQEEHDAGIFGRTTLPLSSHVGCTLPDGKRAIRVSDGYDIYDDNDNWISGPHSFAEIMQIVKNGQ